MGSHEWPEIEMHLLGLWHELSRIKPTKRDDLGTV